MDVYLLRHAEINNNGSAHLSQGCDGSLSERGVLQSQSIVDTLRKFDIEQILCSPYERAINTISPYVLQYKVPIEIHPCLAEGQLVLDKDTPHEAPDYEDSPSGHRYPCKNETKGQFLTRARDATDLIIEKKLSYLLVVSHGHMIRELVNNLLPLKTKIRFPHENCGLSCISIGKHTMVKFINRNIDSLS